MESSSLIFEVETEGLRDAGGRFAAFKQEMADAVRDEFRDLGRAYVDVLRDEAPEDTGRLKRGITFKTHQTDTVTELRVSSAVAHTGFVMRGTKPHAAPISALQGWADRHGINVWAVWQSIKREGTSVWSERVYGEKANRFQKRAEERMRPAVREATTRLTGHVRKSLVGI